MSSLVLFGLCTPTDGTSYADYYSRYRPGLGMVLGMLTVFTCFIQYFFLYMKHYLALQQIKQCVHLQQLSPRIY